MIAQEIGSFADSIIMICAGAYFIFARANLLQKIVDHEKKAKAERTFRIIGPTLIFFGLVLAGLEFINHEDNLTRVARDINARCPKVVDASTRMDGAVPVPGKELIISYTITSLNASEIDRTTWTNQMVPAIRQKFRKLSADSDLSKLVADGLNIVYRYSGKDGIFFDDVVISQSSLRE